DAAQGPVIEGAVTEVLGTEIRLQLPVHSIEQIQIETGGDALRIVIGRFQNGAILLEIDSDQQAAGGSQQRRNAAQQSARLVGCEVADGRPREINDPPATVVEN